MDCSQKEALYREHGKLLNRFRKGDAEVSIQDLLCSAAKLPYPRCSRMERRKEAERIRIANAEELAILDATSTS